MKKKFKNPPKSFSNDILKKVYEIDSQTPTFKNQDILKDSLKPFEDKFDVTQTQKLIELSQIGQYDMMHDFVSKDIGLNKDQSQFIVSVAKIQN